MYFGLQNNFLYTAFRIEVTFADDLSKELKGYGTCFFVRNSKDEIVIVTNRHVTDKTFKEQSGKYKNFKLKEIWIKGKKNDDKGLPSIEQELKVISFELTYPNDYDNDVAVLKNLKVQTKPGIPADIDFLVAHGLIATDDKIKTGLEISDFVAFPGFPDWYDKKENRPILRFGTIASDPRYNYSNNKEVNGDCIAYEAFSYGGSSGSPVYALQRGFLGGDIEMQNSREFLLVGVNAGHLKTEAGDHSGISYFYKASLLLNMIE